jgi:CHAT domain-containing protein
MPRRPSLLLPLLLGLLAACAEPPASAFVSGRLGSAEGEPVGSNAVNEACTRQPMADGGSDVYCGNWTQPSARIRPAGNADPGQVATASAWRSALDQRFTCGAPRPTTILGGAPAVLLQCTRRVGGWPHLGLVAQVGGATWTADGVEPALPVMERVIGIATGRARAEGPGVAASGAEALIADRLAARAFGSNNIAEFDALMTAGNRANHAENAVAAETAFRAALGVQERALGADNPALATTHMLLALQLSNQGRFPAAEASLARAAALVARAGAEQQALAARLAHHRGLHLLNQAKYAEALAQFDAAAAGYARQLPPAMLQARAVPQRRGEISVGGLAGAPAERSALYALIEVRRSRAIALAELNRPAEAEASLRAAETLARGNLVQVPVMTARLARSTAIFEAERGNEGEAASALALAASSFARAVPNTRPVARTELLRAAQLARLGREGEVIAACRNAVSVLTQLRSGVEAELLEPCLAAYASAARDQAASQGLLAEMFAAAQLAQSGVTAQQIDQATVRLADAARDQGAGQAIRRYQDAQLALGEALRERDELVAQGQARGPALDVVERRIAQAREALAESDSALQAAAPRYGQLVQQAVSAPDVLAKLRPGEAFAAIVLTGRGGWTFVLRDGRIAVAAVEGGEPRVTQLVRRVRAGIERTGPALPRFDTAAAAEIYAATLGKLGPALEGATALAVAPSGALLALPFEVMLTGPADAANLAQAPFLVRRMTVAHVPAAANFVGLRGLEPSRAARPWYGFGDFRPPSLAQASRTFAGDPCRESARLFAGLPVLPAATRELEAARQLLGGRPEDRLVGAGFTADAVRRASLKDARVLHFATHALLPAEIACQQEPAIIASTPGGAPDANGALLTASAVANLDLDADLVILSACNSGGPGGTTAGESLSGLARAFFYAGARALMVTHWSVDDRMAAFLVATAMNEVRQGRGANAALRAAQLGVLDGAGRDLPAEVAHPFYWAAFAVIGEGGAARGASLAAASRL